MSERDIPWRARLAAAIVHASPDWSAALASRVMGRAARLRLPPRVGRVAVAAYAKVFGVNMREVDPVLVEAGFDSFNAFFTRRLREGARSIDRSIDTLVSPCDGQLREVVAIERGTEIRAKGCNYTVGELLNDAVLAERFVGGFASTIYLHPRDYHRVHSPCEALVQRVVLVPGRLLPVTTASLSRNPRLFAINERMVHVLETGVGMVAVIMVAAFGVGHMTCPYHRFAPHPRELQIHHCDPPARLRKGDELGIFHLGSTVILLTEPGVEPLNLPVPTPVLLGQPLLRDTAGSRVERKP